ncbi:hypothetical protein [Clostridium sp.]|uniref:hypothetical protein n=1 Tax=Clostridium sp. TaxID=1506 RepID=UPI002590740C|nr:hypothetical protein [Clostridium sp.]
MKKIIHFKLPVDNHGEIKVTCQIANNFYKSIKRVLPKYYLPIITPFDVKIQGKIVKFDIQTFDKYNKDIETDKIIKHIKDTIKKEGFEVEIIK